MQQSKDEVVLKSRKWNAHWIWIEEDSGNTPNSFWLFRREFSLAQIPRKPRAYIAADTRYQLFVNGQFVGRGAPQSQPWFQYYDERNLSKLLREGVNCFGLIVNYVGNMPDTRGGLLLEMVDGSDEMLLKTDSDWRATQARAWDTNMKAYHSNATTPYQESFDARLMPSGWTQPGFDDSSWRGTVALGGEERPPAVPPWVRLVPRDIPFMTAEPILPESIAYTEECVDLANRPEQGDLTKGLSMVGNPVQHSEVEGAENLCSEDGETSICCSTKQLNGIFDGIYDPCVIIDFGRVVTGRPRLEMEGPGGAKVEIGYAERLIDGHFNNMIEGLFADRCILEAGENTYEPFTWKSFRYLKIRVRSCFEPLRIKSLQGVISTYPYDETGTFKSEDEQLEKCWEISRYTLRLCSNEFIMDTPWREQAQWLGDVAGVTLGGIYSCFGDTKLPGKFLRQAAANQQPTGLISNVSNRVNHGWQRTIPDYSLWWIMGLWNHYRFSGQEEWIRYYYPTVRRIIQAFLPYLNEHGLLENMPYWVFVDWADVDKRGECAPLNAVFAGALETAEKMAEMNGDAKSLERYNNLFVGIQANLQDRCYDEEAGCFSDARVDGILSAKHSEHASMAPIRWGLCEESLSHEIIDRLYVDESVGYTEAQPFFSSVVLQALDRAGRFELALKLIRERWGKRMVERGTHSTFEEWYMNGSWRSGEFKGFMRTKSHAWSAHPAEFLIRNLIGFKIVEAGCGRVKLNPKETEFDYNVTCPTPRGPIQVANSGGEINITVPETVELVD
ncbi:MAG: family 78 glycoside hydrolase catalytic domain [Candidatus Brocadiia bacterium]